MSYTAIKTTYLYTYDQLSDTAKGKAREWYLSDGCNYDWWDCVYKDARECGRILGIDIDNIYFSGFCCQGDGAQFEGSYFYSKGSSKAIREHAPNDKWLHEIADRLAAIQRPYFYGLTAKVKSDGHDYHEYCTDIRVYDGNENDYSLIRINIDTEKLVSECLRNFMSWIYRQLEQEYNHSSSDEVVADKIIDNEYLFNENGVFEE